jgi:hypothetical protein
VYRSLNVCLQLARCAETNAANLSALHITMAWWSRLLVIAACCLAHARADADEYLVGTGAHTFPYQFYLVLLTAMALTVVSKRGAGKADITGPAADVNLMVRAGLVL